MCEPISATAVLAGAALAGTAATIYNGQQQKKAQAKAQATTEANAAATAKQAELATNKANAKAPNTAALASANVLAANGGQGSTMLTGASGISNDQLSLGKTTLLGG